jgi:hypothetical protein
MRVRGSTHLLGPAGLLLAAVASGCATLDHSVEPYRSDPAAAAALEERAEAACRSMRADDDLPPRRFVTDGCSAWPDGSWVECCVVHDIPYWCGGTREQRRQADRTLRQCVANTHSGWLGNVMGLGVRAGGHPVVPARWRWGFGRDYPACYESPPPEGPETNTGGP